MTRAAHVRGLVLAGLAVVSACRGGDRAGGGGAGRGDDVRVLDAFDDLAAWHATGSDGVTATIQRMPGVHGTAMRLAFDLGRTAGYAVARRDLALELPGDFELSFELRGDVPLDNLELKLIDRDGTAVTAAGPAGPTDPVAENVWWFRRADFAFPARWRRMVVRRRQIEFAWGPAADHTLRRIAAIELVVSTGKGGGKGWVEIDDLAIRRVRAPDGPIPMPRATASSEQPAGAPGLAIDGDLHTMWRSDPAAGPAQRFTLDLGRERDFGGLIVQWGPGYATDYRVELSRDGTTWQPAGDVRGGNGGLDPILIPEASARYVRLQLTGAGGTGGYQLAELAVVELGDAATRDAPANALIEALARQLPRGSLPRGFSGEQPYWTIAGVDGGGAHNSLVSEDGALELASGASVEPFVEAAGTTTSWATAGDITQALADGYLPIPSVTWHAGAWDLTITALALGEPARQQLAARYTLHNRTAAALPARLVLAIRPFQVNPPRQFLNRAGGVRRIARIAWGDSAIALDGAIALFALAPPTQVSLWPFHALGYPLAPIARTPLTVTDPAELASGALAYDLTLPPGGDASVVIAAPLAGDPVPPEPGAAAAWFDAQLATARTAWHAKLDRVGLRVPAAGRALADTLRSSLAYILISRDGAILRPGTRSYARAWIRDGAMIGEALLRLGHPDVAAAFLGWYAPYQAASGKVPCCVEAHGAVPVPEHDSHGELIHLAAEVYRYTRDRDALAAAWPHVQAAARALDELRATERTPANQTAARRAQYGLLPPSISHEGYSAKPAYSYWDDFWGLTGYRDAAWLAGELGDTAAATQLAAARDAFERDLLASIAASAADHHVGYIPGAAELGDFDATSTTIALSPGGELHALPPALVTTTFERAWQALVDRHPGPRPTAHAPSWDAYTPYELRLVGAFIRLGWRARAFDALTWYLADQRPRAWNQWAEVVGKNPREPRFIGDLPHAWVHSDYARAVLDMFAYERDDHALVLAAGIPEAWFADGFAIHDLPTPYGPLSYEVTQAAGEITLHIGPGAMPPGGLVVASPWSAPGALSLHVKQRPATLVLSRSGDPKHL
ncbi:MAG TPA: discoidin domain-containing protein [Kofleriaceae bacterium]|jgi:hypothetical protein|nr:discoidin domain-containing protein [Kofleriaceae bacterium]